MSEDRHRLEGQTWHHGLVAQWWTNKVATPEELAYYGAAIRTYGEPALDLACGTGRLLVPLIGQGLEVDGVDVSEAMLAGCRTRAEAAGVQPRLRAQPMHELALDRRYRTVYVCDSWGIGGSRRNDREALRRIYDHLEPGGALVMSIGYPYDHEEGWRLWLPDGRQGLPRPWPESPGRQEQPDGSVILQWLRLVDLDPRAQRIVLGIRDQLVRDGEILLEEEREIVNNVYLEQELRLMLEFAGFADVSFQAGYSGRPATVDVTEVTLVARRTAG